VESFLEQLEIAVDGERIAGTLLMHTAKVPGVLFVHGWGGSQEQDLARAKEVVGLGCICLTFDLRGHKLMEAQRETVTREQNLNDLIAAYDLIANLRGVDPQSIAVIGASYGGYLAALLTKQRPVRWLALRAPALYKDANWQWPKRQLHVDPEFAAYRQSSIRAQDNRALGACAEFKGDVLIIESENDEIIPQVVIKNYVGAFSQTRSLSARIISGGDHALASEACQRAYTKVLLTWLTEMVSGARQNGVPATAAEKAVAAY
jgi:pimeloyl-ACP methyl ester carboxylesterase